MRFRHVNTYPATIEQVHEMLLDPAFREEVCRAVRAVEHTVSVDRSTTPATVRVAQTQLARKIPPMAQKLIGETVEIVQDEQWASADSARLEVGIPGKPGHLRGTIRLEQVDGEVRQLVEGDLKVAVPLVGGKLEGLIAQLLGKALTAEGQVGVSWLDGRSG